MLDYDKFYKKFEYIQSIAILQSVYYCITMFNQFSSKKEQFQMSIRRKYHESYRQQLRKKREYINQLEILLNILYQSTHTEQTSDLMIQLQSLLSNINIRQIPQSSLKLIKPLCEGYIPNFLSEILPENIRLRCISILCMLTENIELTNSKFNESSMMTIIGQITDNYVSPNYTFYQSLAAIGNFLSCSYQKPGNWQTIFQLLQNNQIQQILCSILAIRNYQLKQYETVQNPYFKTEQEEETFIWFVSKYLKVKDFKEDPFRHQNMVNHLQTYAFQILKLKSNQQIIHQQDSIYKFIVQIIRYASLTFSAYISQMTNILKEIIIKNSGLKQTANLFIHIVTLRIWNYEECEILIKCIVQTIVNTGEHPVTSLRDKTYLLGISCVLQDIKEQEAIQIWQLCEQQMAKILQRRQLYKKVSNIENLIRKLKDMIDN